MPAATGRRSRREKTRVTPLVKKLALWAAGTAVLLGVFALYTRPDMMVLVSEMIWACFN